MSQYKVLVVEDDAGLREALIDTLTLANYECVEADSGETALLLLKNHSVDIVVSDVQMGGMSGLSLLKNIKSNHPNLPVLLISKLSTTHPFTFRRAADKGYSGFFLKSGVGSKLSFHGVIWPIATQCCVASSV